MNIHEAFEAAKEGKTIRCPGSSFWTQLHFDESGNCFRNSSGCQIVLFNVKEILSQDWKIVEEEEIIHPAWG